MTRSEEIKIMSEKFYMTTAIAYASRKPHFGNTYEVIMSDAVARYRRACGNEVFFCTGTDEHGQKIENLAKNSLVFDVIKFALIAMVASLAVTCIIVIWTGVKEQENRKKSVYAENGDINAPLV